MYGMAWIFVTFFLDLFCLLFSSKGKMLLARIFLLS